MSLFYEVVVVAASWTLFVAYVAGLTCVGSHDS